MIKQNQKVEFRIENLIGRGKIVGKALNDMPIIGGAYIIEPEESIKSDVYDYTHFIAFENQLTLIND